MSAKEPLDLPQAFKKAQELYAAGPEEKEAFWDLFEKICSEFGVPPVSDVPRFRTVCVASEDSKYLTFLDMSPGIGEDKAIAVQAAKRHAIRAVAEGKPVDTDSVPKEFLERLKPFMVTNQK